MSLQVLGSQMNAEPVTKVIVTIVQPGGWVN